MTERENMVAFQEKEVPACERSNSAFEFEFYVRKTAEYVAANKELTLKALNEALDIYGKCWERGGVCVRTLTGEFTKNLFGNDYNHDEGKKPEHIIAPAGVIAAVILRAYEAKENFDQFIKHEGKVSAPAIDEIVKNVMLNETQKF